MAKNKTLLEQAQESITLDDLEYTTWDISSEDKEKVEQSGDTIKYAPYFSSFRELESFVLYEMNTRFKYLQEIDKNYYMCNFDRAEFLEKEKKSWRSNIKSILTNMFVNRVVNMVLEFDKTFSILDKKADRRVVWDELASMNKSKRIVDEINALIDTVISDEENKNAIHDWFKDTIKDWFTSQKIWIMIKEKTRKFKAYNIEESVTYKQEKVTIDYVSNYNIIYSYGSRRNIRFIAERLLMSDQQIVDEYVVKHWLKWYTPKQWDETDHKILIPYDFETIKQSLVFYNYKNQTGIVWWNTGARASKDLQEWVSMVDWKNFKIEDIFSIKMSGKLREVYEVYHDEEDGLYMDVYVNGTYLWTALCNSVIDGYKYYKLTYRRIPWGMDWVWVGTICMPTQRAYDVILNSRIDNVIINTNTIYLKRRGLNIGLGNWTVDMSPWSMHEVDDTQRDISIMQRTAVPPEAYNEPDSMFQMLQAGIGIGSQVLGVQSKVERVSGQSEMLKAASEEQMNEFIESMNWYFNRLAKNIIIYYKTIISEKTIEKILWKDNLFMEEDLEDILLDFSWSFDISSQKAKYNAALTQILINFLGVVWNLVDEKGQKVANVRDIVMEIAKRQGLDWSTILWDQEVVRTLGDITKWMWVTDTSGVIPWGEDITALNQFGGAGSMWEFAPNAAWVNV